MTVYKQESTVDSIKRKLVCHRDRDDAFEFLSYLIWNQLT